MAVRRGRAAVFNTPWGRPLPRKRWPQKYKIYRLFFTFRKARELLERFATRRTVRRRAGLALNRATAYEKKQSESTTAWAAGADESIATLKCSDAAHGAARREAAWIQPKTVLFG